MTMVLTGGDGGGRAGLGLVELVHRDCVMRGFRPAHAQWLQSVA